MRGDGEKERRKGRAWMRSGGREGRGWRRKRREENRRGEARKARKTGPGHSPVSLFCLFAFSKERQPPKKHVFSSFISSLPQPCANTSSTFRYCPAPPVSLSPSPVPSPAVVLRPFTPAACSATYPCTFFFFSSHRPPSAPHAASFGSTVQNVTVKQQTIPSARPPRWSLDAKSAKRSSARTWSKNCKSRSSLLFGNPPKNMSLNKQTDPPDHLIDILKKRTSTAHTAITSSLSRQRPHRWVLLSKGRTREWATGKTWLYLFLRFTPPMCRMRTDIDRGKHNPNNVCLLYLGSRRIFVSRRTT